MVHDTRANIFQKHLITPSSALLTNMRYFHFLLNLPSCPSVVPTTGALRQSANSGIAIPAGGDPLPSLPGVHGTPHTMAPTPYNVFGMVVGQAAPPAGLPAGSVSPDNDRMVELAAIVEGLSSKAIPTTIPPAAATCSMVSGMRFSV